MPWYENHSGDPIWYEEHGSGVPVIFLHGWCMTSAIWRMQIEPLSANLRIITPDLRGFGRSPRGSGACDLHSFADDVLALAEHLHLSGVILAGWSMGAQIAVLAAADGAIRLSGLVLVSGTPCFTRKDDFPYGLWPSESEGMALKVRRNLSKAFSGFIRNMFADGEFEDHLLEGRIGTILSTIPLPDPDVALETLESLASSDIRGIFGRIEIPGMILYGENDTITLPKASKWMAGKMISARIHGFSGAGHAPFLTRAEEFNSCMISFFRELQFKVSGGLNV